MTITNDANPVVAEVIDGSYGAEAQVGVIRAVSFCRQVRRGRRDLRSLVNCINL